MNIKDIRRAAVPLCGVESADPAMTIKGIVSLLTVNGEGGSKSMPPLAQWDIAAGLVGMNPSGKTAVKWYDPLTHPLPEMLNQLRLNLIPGLVVFVHGISRYWDRDGVVQAIWNLRDVFKGNGSTLILLGPVLKLPAELQSDVVVITENPPSASEITVIVDRVLDAAGKAGAKVADTSKPEVVSALRGLGSAFDCEQTLSLCISKASGVDVSECWQRKIKRVKSTTGMEITINNPDFRSLAGCDNVKAELNAFINGRHKPGVVLFMDEIEKLFAGAGTDLSGVSTSLVGLFLSWTADKRARGILLPGVPGSGKTWTANCTAGEAKVPFCKLSDIKAGIVGESEAKLRSALAAVESLAGEGSILMIASCNWVDSLAPDIMSRFTLGQFFYDFPTDEERKALWKMYIKKHELPKQELPESDGWVGREIDSACWRAWQYNKPLLEVARNICPSSVAQKAKLDALRKACSGRFLSAARPGVYEVRDIESRKPGQAGVDRAMSFE